MDILCAYKWDIKSAVMRASWGQQELQLGRWTEISLLLKCCNHFTKKKKRAALRNGWLFNSLLEVLMKLYIGNVKSIIKLERWIFVNPFDSSPKHGHFWWFPKPLFLYASLTQFHCNQLIFLWAINPSDNVSFLLRLILLISYLVTCLWSSLTSDYIYGSLLNFIQHLLIYHDKFDVQSHYTRQHIFLKLSFIFK